MQKIGDKERCKKKSINGDEGTEPHEENNNYYGWHLNGLCSAG